MSNTPRPTRNEQREAARAKAREMRLAQKRNASRKRTILISSIVAVVAIIVTSVVLTISNEVNNPVPTAATPANMNFDGGIKIGTDLKAFTATEKPTTADVPNIEIFLDYQCPFCQAFELPNASLIESKVAAGEWTIEYHPLSFLDGAGSPNAYSSRAANAAVCVAEYSPNKFMTFNNLLFANQPAEQTAGPENDGLIAFAQQVGADNFDKIQTCINEKSYGDWVSETTSSVLNAAWKDTGLTIDSTPYIIVNGQRYTGTAEEMASPARFEQWVTAAWNG